MESKEGQEVRNLVFHLFGGVGTEKENGFTLSSIAGRMSQFLEGDDERRDSLKPIFLISSRGGSTEEALRIHAYLSCLPIEITTVGIGLVESAATIVYLAGKRRLATPSTIFLFHEGTVSLSGIPSSRIVEAARAQAMKDHAMIEIVAKITGNKKQVARWCRSARSLDAREAENLGIVHEIVDELFSGDTILA